MKYQNKDSLSYLRNSENDRAGLLLKGNTYPIVGDACTFEVGVN